MVARRELESRSPRASAGGVGAEGASSHDDDVRFWRERALRLAESGQAGPSGDALGGGRRPGAAAAALDALLRPRASEDDTRVERPTSTLGGRASARRALDTNPTSVGPAGDGTKMRRAETHAAVASLHAVAADLTERAEAVDAELAALVQQKSDAHERRARAVEDCARRAAAPLERRRDRIARLVEDVERSLRRVADEGFDVRSAALRVREEAARARDARDAIARDTEKEALEARRSVSRFAEDEDEDEDARGKSRMKNARDVAGPNAASSCGRPPAARGFAFSPPASPRRRRASSSEARPSAEPARRRDPREANPPWDKRVALDTSRDDGARARRLRSRSESPVRETKRRDASSFETRTSVIRDAAREKTAEDKAEAEARRKVLAGEVPWYAGAIPPRTTFPPPSPGWSGADPNGRSSDFAAAFWPDFSAYGYGGGAAGMRPGDASSRVEALRGGYQTALLEMQRVRAAEREAAAAAAEAAARELELQRAQLAAIASRLAEAAGVPSAPGTWGETISRATDAAAFDAEAERSEVTPGPTFAAAAAAARERKNRARRRECEYDEQAKGGAETPRAQRRGASSSSTVSAMSDLAEVARVTRERMKGTSADETSAHAAVATAARDEARAARAESMLARTAVALEGEVRGSDAEFGRILDQLRVARDRVESDGDARGTEQGAGSFDEEAFVLNGILAKADAEARSDAEAAAAAAAIRGSFEARGETPGVSAASPKRPARRRQLGDRVPPDPRRPSSLTFKGPARFGVRGEAGDVPETVERETYEVVGPASFSVNAFGSLVAARDAGP